MRDRPGWLSEGWSSRNGMEGSNSKVIKSEMISSGFQPVPKRAGAPNWYPRLLPSTPAGAQSGPQKGRGSKLGSSSV